MVSIKLLKPYIVSGNTSPYWSDGDHVFYFPSDRDTISLPNNGYFPSNIYVNDCYLNYGNNDENIRSFMTYSIVQERFSEDYWNSMLLAKYDTSIRLIEPSYLKCQGTHYVLQMNKNNVVVDSVMKFWKDVRSGWFSYGYWGVDEQDVPLFDSMLNSITIYCSQMKDSRDFSVCKEYTELGCKTTTSFLQVCKYKNGRLHGRYFAYDNQGVLREKGKYKYGNKIGVWYLYDCNGQVLVVRKYDRKKGESNQ